MPMSPEPIISAGSPVWFNDDAYRALNEMLRNANPSMVVVLCDANTARHCQPGFLSMLETDAPLELIEIEPGEDMKTVQTCLEIWHALTEIGADRKSLIVNLGGGVVTDLGGFIASAYKRGVGFVNVPTTLLGMVDAAIGGKNGVDIGPLKNQVGTISSPALVVVDTSFLETLPKRELRSGYAEMLKHGLIADARYWEQLSSAEDFGGEEFDSLIARSVEIKSEIVTRDPTENGLRKSLNFGHTLGHAIESHFLSCGKPVLHGEAVAAGMVLEAFLSMEKGLLEPSDYNWVKKTIISMFGVMDISSDAVPSILQLLVHDKKNEHGRTLFALIAGIGTPALDIEAGNDLIVSAFDDYRNIDFD